MHYPVRPDKIECTEELGGWQLTAPFQAISPVLLILWVSSEEAVK